MLRTVPEDTGSFCLPETRSSEEMSDGMKPRRKKEERRKCPKDCPYPQDGFCMGICMAEQLRNHRKRWGFRYHLT